MSKSELQQAVVFAMRFEYATQLFSLPTGSRNVGLTLEQLGLTADDPLPAGVKPLERPNRVREYWADVLEPGTLPRDYPKEWCGALCLFSLHRAELGLDVFWKGGFAARVLRQLEPHELPQPGDVAYFERYQHHAIVERVDAAAGTFDSIDGNQGPGILRHRGRPLSSVKGFYSLDRLIERKEAQHGTEI